MSSREHAMELRRLHLAATVDRKLNELPDLIRDRFAALVGAEGIGAAYVQFGGVEPSTDEVIAALWSSPFGRDAAEVLRAEPPEQDDRAALLAEIEKLPPVQRLAAARKAGLA